MIYAAIFIVAALLSLAGVVIIVRRRSRRSSETPEAQMRREIGRENMRKLTDPLLYRRPASGSVAVEYRHRGVV